MAPELLLNKVVRFFVCVGGNVNINNVTVTYPILNCICNTSNGMRYKKYTSLGIHSAFITG